MKIHLVKALMYISVILVFLFVCSEYVRVKHYAFWNDTIAAPFRHAIRKTITNELQAANPVGRTDIRVYVRSLRHYWSVDRLDIELYGNGIHNLEPLAGLRINDLRINCTSDVDLAPLAHTKINTINLEYTRRLSNLHALDKTEAIKIEFNRDFDGDLSVIKNLRLVELDLTYTGVDDLSLLANMPLQSLDISGTEVRDLTPLAKCPLKFLSAYETKITDLTPLANMPLQSLGISGTEVRDLTPLANCPLELLTAYDTKVVDLSPLKKCPLIGLYIAGAPVGSIKPLEGLAIQHLELSGTNVPSSEYDILRKMPLVQCDIDY